MQYKALAQNTYKFVNETTINGQVGIDEIYASNLPRVIVSGDSTTTYIPLVPLGSNYSADSYSQTADSGVKTCNPALVAKISNQVKGGSVTVDGSTFYGYKNAQYGFTRSSQSGGLAQLIIATVDITVVKYVSNLNSITYSKYAISGATISAPTYPTGSTDISFQSFIITIPKETDDLILGIYAEAPNN